MSLDWSVFEFNKHKRESLERDCAEETLWKDWKFHSKKIEISLFAVWKFTLNSLKFYSYGGK